MGKRILMLMLSAALLLGGCAAPEREGGGSESVTLRVWVGDNADLPWLETVIADYRRQYPDKQVTFEPGVQNEGDVAKAVLADVQSAADVFTFADDQLPQLLAAGALMPIEEVAGAVRSAHLPGAVKAAEGPDGQLYAFPATADNGYFLFYNTEFLTREDVSTLEGLLDACAAKGKQFAFPLTNGWYLYAFFKGAGLDMHLGSDGLTNVCNWNATDAPISGVQVLEAMMKAASHPGFVSADSDEFVAGLKSGRIIAGVSGTWNASAAATAWGEHYAATKLPTYAAGGQTVQMASFSGYKLVGVNAYAAHVGEAMDFAAFMTGQEAQLSRFAMRRQGPSHMGALQAEAVQQEPAIAALREQAPFATVQRVGSRYWDAAAALGQIIRSGNPDGTPLQTLLDRCVAGITAPAGQ